MEKVFKEDISVVEGMQKEEKVFILMEENFHQLWMGQLIVFTSGLLQIY